MTQRIKRVCFTLNNYTLEDEQRIQDGSRDFEYAIYGREIAPTTGTRHLQGFINFKRRFTFSVLKRIIGDSAYITPSHGTDKQNKDYCSKSGDVWEFGICKGYRSDLEGVIASIRTCQSIRDIADEHTGCYIRYWRGIERAFELLGNPIQRSWKTRVHVLYGEPGTGKSRRANELANQAQGGVYYKPTGKWWDRYNGQKQVIIDDFYGWLQFDELLRITDRYPHQVEVKGSYHEFLAENIYITSNRAYTEWYKGEWFGDMQREALFRRIDTILFYTKETVITEKSNIDDSINNLLNEIDL
ncbi:replication-associated protein [robinz virus RP_1124]|nr:replication-associated protein [robinz virus RP_1124]